MSVGNGHALEYAGDEGGSERIACAYGVGHFYLGSRLKGHRARREYIATVDAASEDEHLEIVFAEKDPAFVLKVDAGISEHSAYSHKLLVIYFKDIATLHGVADDFLVEETLP